MYSPCGTGVDVLLNIRFAGARFSLGWFRIHLEAQWATGIVSYAASAGFKFP